MSHKPEDRNSGKESARADHSNWANIQHRKVRQVAVRSEFVSRVLKGINLTAKISDPDQEKNPRLCPPTKETRTNSVPKDVIERAISKSQPGEGAE